MSEASLLDPIAIPARSAREEWLSLRDGGHLLHAPQVAEFVSRGVLSFPSIVPAELNQAVLAALDDRTLVSRDLGYRDEPLAARWPGPHPLGRVFRLPAVRGIIASLVGPDPVHDHHAIHSVGAGHRSAQGWHADAAIDPREDAFDIQLMYFPHDTPRDMGGTMLLPGSHLRVIHEGEASRYHHFVGQMPTICSAGTIHVLHHGLWHRARGNSSDRQRTMIKLRLNPTWKQEGLFDLTGHDAPEIGNILAKTEPWQGSDRRIEIINRVRLWRHLTGDHAYDVHRWLGRLAASPSRRLHG